MFLGGRIIDKQTKTPARAAAVKPQANTTQSGAYLSNPIGSVNALVVCGWVPGGVNNDHPVSSGQGQTQTSNL
jgi:hypothetical protein